MSLRSVERSRISIISERVEHTRGGRKNNIRDTLALTVELTI